MTLHKWKIFCVAENKFKILWNNLKPTTCPSNNLHAVNLNSIHYLEQVVNYKIIDATTENPYNITNYNFYVCDTTPNDVTINLPVISSVKDDQVYIIQKLSNTHQLIIQPALNNGPIITLTNNYQTLKLLVNKITNTWTQLDINTSIGENDGLLEVNTSNNTGGGSNSNLVWILGEMQPESFNSDPSVGDMIYHKRIINSMFINSGSDITFNNNNQFVMQSGTYDVFITSTFYRTGNTILALYNATTTDYVAYSNSCNSPDDSGASTINPIITTKLIISSATPFEIHYSCNNSRIDGLGISSGNTNGEVYSLIKIIKLS